MKVKCGRVEYELDSTDLIMYNGACYQLVTKKVWKSWFDVSPILAKTKAEKLIKEGLLIEANRKNDMGINLIYYKVAK